MALFALHLDPSGAGSADHTSAIIAMFALAFTLLSGLVVSIWKFATLTTTFQTAIDRLEKTEEAQNKEAKESIKERQKMERLILKLTHRVKFLEHRAGITRGSHPDSDDEEEDTDGGED